MADISKRAPGCDDEGERGKRGPRGHDGQDGAPGPTGPTGPSEGALIGRQVFNVVEDGAVYTPTPGTRRAIVRGAGGGGGGGGVSPTTGSTPLPAAASGGNSGTGIEIEIIALPNTLLTGGPVTVGAGGAGGIGSNLPPNGVDGSVSTLLIGGVLRTAPGGRAGS